MTDLIPKINKILKGFMGEHVRLEYQPAKALVEQQWVGLNLTTAEALPSVLENQADGSFAFPIVTDGALQGLAVVKGWMGSRPNQLVEIAGLLTDVLEFGSRDEIRLDKLRSLEEKLVVMKGADNVIPLRPSRLAQVRKQIVELEELEAFQAKSLQNEMPKEAQELSSMPVLIQVQPGFPLHPVAVELHEVSGRWAMLSLSDLPADTLSSRESIKELGNLTLFIKDLAALTTEQQIKLGEYLAIKPDADMPQIIAGITASPKELIEGGKVLAHLFELFCLMQWSEKETEGVTTGTITASLRNMLKPTGKKEHVVGQHVIPFNARYFDPDHPTVH